MKEVRTNKKRTVKNGTALSKDSIKKAKKKKATYKIRNWKEYNESLVRRYDINVWMENGIAEVWREGNTIIIRRRKKVGAPREYSDMAIECLATVQDLFDLPYRGIEGFARSLIPVLLQKTVPIPDYSTINRRKKDLTIQLPKGKNRDGKIAIDIVIDSSGLKVYGEGEWKVRQHGTSKRRTWRKIHLGVNPETGDIEAFELTENSVDDGAMVDPLLHKIQKEIDAMRGDGAYDKRKVYEALKKHRVKRILIPPREDAHIWFHGNKRGDPHPRDTNIRDIREVGRKKWKQQSGYHMRSHAEVAVYRFKTILSGTLSAREWEHQKVEVAIKCKILNTMTSLGMPDSYKVDFEVT